MSQPPFQQPPFQQPPFQQQPFQQPPAHPVGELVVICREPPLFGAAMMSPKLLIDGYPAVIRWGETRFRVPAGVRRLNFSAVYMWEFGGAQYDVEIFPGQSSVAHYSAPLTTTHKGLAGPVEQPRPGLRATVTIGVVALLIAVAVAVPFALFMAKL